MTEQTFASLHEIAVHLRKHMQNKKIVLLFAYNGTGKTRLSVEFKDLGKRPVTSEDHGSVNDPVTSIVDHGSVADPVEAILDHGEVSRDTLYFNAFTEDLFAWDNDLENDQERVLKMNPDSRLLKGLEELEMENRIRPFLQRYADFDFSIDYEKWNIIFSRKVNNPAYDESLQDSEQERTNTITHIKVSRGEENIFVWCFFLAIVQLAIDGADAYEWVKYVYVDDPISSLDDNNAIAVACHLTQLLKGQDKLRAVISSHHALFFNVLYNEFSKADRYFLTKNRASDGYILRGTGDTPFFHHVAALVELRRAADSGKLYTHHFNMLRAILEKTANFHGHKDFSVCLNSEADEALHKRMIGILSHGNYSLFEPQEMIEENKGHFKDILDDFIKRYPFNPDLFPVAAEPVSA